MPFDSQDLRASLEQCMHQYMGLLRALAQMEESYAALCAQTRREDPEVSGKMYRLIRDCRELEDALIAMRAEYLALLEQAELRVPPTLD